VVKIIGDTTSGLPESFAQSHDIPIIPQIINIGDESYLEGVEITYETFLEKLKVAVSTSWWTRSNIWLWAVASAEQPHCQGVRISARALYRRAGGTSSGAAGHSTAELPGTRLVCRARR
jgi:hypothetical protein